MSPGHTTRGREGKAHTYWHLVRSVRVGRKVVQQTVAHLEHDADLHSASVTLWGSSRTKPARRRGAEPITSQSSECIHALLKLLQPVGHPHLAVHRRRGAQVLLGLLGFT